jgi:hypothetical protein
MIKNKNLFKVFTILTVVSALVSCKETKNEPVKSEMEAIGMSEIKVSDNGHYFQTESRFFGWQIQGG